MNETIETSIKQLTERAGMPETKPDDALKLSQAALNLAHVFATYHNARN